MATLFITEYRELQEGPEGQLLPIPKEPALADQAVTFTTSAASSAFNEQTHFVRLYSDVDCHVVFGKAPTATASKQKLAGGVDHWRAVQPGQDMKVAAYDGSS